MTEKYMHKLVYGNFHLIVHRPNKLLDLYIYTQEKRYKPIKNHT